MRTLTIHFFAKLFVAALMFSFVSVALAQEDQPNLVQVVGLDECDPATFNAVLGPDICKNA